MKQINSSEIKGVLPAPPSKSMMIRALAASLLNEGISQIINPSDCDDSLTAIQIIEALGADIRKDNRTMKVTGGLNLKKSILHCNESGLCMRLFTPVTALFNQVVTITGLRSLKSRPMGMMEEPLRKLGTHCLTDNGLAPIQVKGLIKGGKVNLEGSTSSQFLTGLLMTLPLCKEDSELTVIGLKSRPYVEMTINMLERSGITISPQKEYSFFSVPGNQSYHSTNYIIEGDWSGAAFFLVAGAVKGWIKIKNLYSDSLQADKTILDILNSVGAEISTSHDTVEVKHKRLDAFNFDATDCPDLFPPLTALACCCKGCSVITGVGRLKHKESNRAKTLVSEFTKIGADIRIDANQLKINGKKIKGGIIDSHNDHRIAMAGAIAGLFSRRGVKIENWQAVSKSYPGFYNDLRSIGGKIQ